MVEPDRQGETGSLLIDQKAKRGKGERRELWAGRQENRASERRKERGKERKSRTQRENIGPGH